MDGFTAVQMGPQAPIKQLQLVYEFTITKLMHCIISLQYQSNFQNFNGPKIPGNKRVKLYVVQLCNRWYILMPNDIQNNVKMEKLWLTLWYVLAITLAFSSGRIIQQLKKVHSGGCKAKDMFLCRHAIHVPTYSPRISLDQVDQFSGCSFFACWKVVPHWKIKIGLFSFDSPCYIFHH